VLSRVDAQPVSPPDSPLFSHRVSQPCSHFQTLLLSRLLSQWGIHLPNQLHSRRANRRVNLQVSLL
jgi:hypothetical protein